MKSRWLVIGALVALVWAGLAPGAAADAGDRTIRFGVLQSNPTDDLELPGETLEVDDAFGFHGSFEYMVTDLIGIEPAVSFTSHDVEVEPVGLADETFGEFDLLAVTGTVNFHVMRGERVSVHVGPTVGFGLWSDFDPADFPQDVSVDNEIIFGGTAGIDVPFGGGAWGFTGGIDYWLLDATAEGTPPPFDEMGVDPFRLKVGLSYSF